MSVHWQGVAAWKLGKIIVNTDSVRGFQAVEVKTV